MWEENQERCPYGTSSGRKNQEYQIYLISQVRLSVYCVIIVVNVHVYVYRHTKHTLMCTFTTIIKENETRNLKESRGLHKGEFGGRKGKEKDVITL